MDRDVENKMLIDSYWQTYETCFSDDGEDDDLGEYDWMDDEEEREARMSFYEWSLEASGYVL